MKDETRKAPATWYLRRDGKRGGPYPSGAVRRFLLLGRIGLDDEVSADGESWQPVRTVAEVVPPELRHSPGEQRELELMRARIREDERSGIDRRSGRADVGHDRRAGDRRQDEPQELVERRRNKTRFLASQPVRSLPWVGLATLALVFSGAIAFGLWHGSAQRPAGPDCTAPPVAGVDWRNCRFERLDRPGAELAGADLQSLHAPGAHLPGADLSRVRLDYGDLARADLSHTSLVGASLVGASLRGADLSYADLSGADLRFADLAGAHPAGVRLDGAKLGDAIWIDGLGCLAGSVGRCLRPAAQPGNDSVR